MYNNRAVRDQQNKSVGEYSTWEEETQTLVPCVGKLGHSNYTLYVGVLFNNIVTIQASCSCPSCKLLFLQLPCVSSEKRKPDNMDALLYTSDLWRKAHLKLVGEQVICY